MRLRSRLFLSAALWTVPVVGLATWGLIERERRVEIERAEDYVGCLQVLARMPWPERLCAIVLAPHVGYRPPWIAERHWLTAGALTAGLLAAVVLAAGPMVARVRRLTDDVRTWAGGRHAAPVAVRGRDEVAALAEAFNAAIHDRVVELERRERALRDFIEDTTHDLMTPLTVLQGHLAALQRAVTGAAASPVRDAMEEVQYTTALIENLGAAARIESAEPALHVGPVELGELVARVAARHVPIARARGVELAHASPEDALVVEADLTLFEQAVGNLVHNAVRFAERGGHVALIAEEDGPDAFAVRVVDDGPGIPEELHPRLFERAFRTDDARSRHPEGRGLGLHIASEVARLHGLRLEIRPRKEGGVEARLGGSRRPA